MEEPSLTVEEIQTRNEGILSCILDMGELLLISGAEVMRVEDTISRLCSVYGFIRADAFTITSSIVLTVHTPEGRVITQTRRIRCRDTDLGRVERVNALSRRLCRKPLELPELREEIRRVKDAPVYSLRVQFVMYAMISTAFSIFFGGVAEDGVTACLSGMVLFLALRFTARLHLNSLLVSFLCSLITALAVAGMVTLGLGVHPDKIVIGNIMLLIPGIAFTTSLRDVISGDTISGLLGISEAVLKALAIAVGFAIVLTRIGG